jgi:FAD/FMN-containing dehydrogenase
VLRSSPEVATCVACGSVGELEKLHSALDGEVLSPVAPRYRAALHPAIARFRDVRPRAVAHCASDRDVVRTVAFARDTGTRVVPRSGGHCLAGRSSTSDGVVLDVSRLDTINIDGNGRAVIGAGARLRQVYEVLHQQGRSLPVGCGPTVGVAGLTLGGGLGLLGRRHGLTCDSLVSAQVVLPDGRLLDCDADREPDLYWALRGAGGGQFGVVTSFVFTTVSEPRTTGFEVRWPESKAPLVISAWQSWAPDAPDDVTANLTVNAEPGHPLQIVVWGAALREADATLALLNQLTALTGSSSEVQLREGMLLADLKRSLATPDPRELDPTASGRSELFAAALPATAVSALLDELTTGQPPGRRELSFTALGGAYNRVAVDASAYAHRAQRFVLEHLADGTDAWVDRSWAIAHRHGTGRVYPNFPDAQLDDPGYAYHGENLARLITLKHHYDPARLLQFPQAV